MGPSISALFFSELTATCNLLIRPTGVKIWTVECYSVALVLKHPSFHLDGSAELWDWIFRERNDSCGLEKSLK